MAIAQHSASMPSLVRSYDGVIIFGYMVFAVVVLAAIYFASEAQFSLMLICRLWR